VSGSGIAQFVEVARAVDGREETGAAVVAALHEMLRYIWQVDARLSWHGVGRPDQRPMLDGDACVRNRAFDALGVGESPRLRHHSRHSNRLK
jgi:hypothetical protein